MMTIGKIAKEAGVGVETVRFYERKGLIKQPKKKAEGFRTYPEEEAKKIRFIRRAQELGFTLKEIKDLLAINASRKATCEDVRVRAENKRREVEQKILDLQKMKDALATIESACQTSPEMVACCKIEDCFEGKCNF